MRLNSFFFLVLFSCSGIEKKKIDNNNEFRDSTINDDLNRKNLLNDPDKINSIPKLFPKNKIYNNNLPKNDNTYFNSTVGCKYISIFSSIVITLYLMLNLFVNDDIREYYNILNFEYLFYNNQNTLFIDNVSSLFEINKDKSFKLINNINDLKININHINWVSSPKHYLYEIKDNDKNIFSKLINVMYWGNNSIEFLFALKSDFKKYLLDSFTNCIVIDTNNFKIFNGNIDCNNLMNPKKKWSLNQLTCFCNLESIDFDNEYRNYYDYIFILNTNLINNQSIQTKFTKREENAFLTLCCETIIHDAKDGYGPPPDILFNQWFEHYINQGIENIYIYDLTTNLSNFTIDKLKLDFYNPRIKNQQLNIFIFNMDFIKEILGHSKGSDIYNQYQVLIMNDCHLRNKLNANWTVFNDLDEYTIINNNKYKDLKHYLRDIQNQNEKNKTNEKTLIGLTECRIDRIYCSKYDFFCNEIDFKENNNNLNNFLDIIRYTEKNNCKSIKNQFLIKYINQPQKIDIVRAHISYDAKILNYNSNIPSKTSVYNSQYSLKSNPNDIMLYHYRILWHDKTCSQKINDHNNLSTAEYMIQLFGFKYKQLYNKTIIENCSKTNISHSFM